MVSEGQRLKKKEKKKKIADARSGSSAAVAADGEEASAPAEAEVVVSSFGTGQVRKITVMGEAIAVSEKCPRPLESFEEAQTLFGKPLTQRLQDQGYKAPFPIQAQAWPIALEGRDLIGIAKAGSGKTCAFLLPALARLQHLPPRPETKSNEPAKPSILVMAPTRELAQQIAGEAAKFGDVARAKIATLYGGVTKMGQCLELKDGADVVIGTPGRLMDFAEGNAELNRRPLLSFRAVSYLVLDEADRMLDMGFAPDMHRIIGECPRTGLREQGGGASGSSAGTARQTLFFTATWPKSVQKTARAFTSADAAHVRVGLRDVTGNADELTTNSDITQTVLVMPKKDKFTRLINLLHTELLPGETAMVFVKTKKTCDLLETKLYDPKENFRVGTWCRGIHSGKEQVNRDRILSVFRSITVGADQGKSEGRRAVLIATDVAARGLDIPGVALVILYDFSGGNTVGSSALETYVHRIGRTARAGKLGKSFAFFTPQDAPGAGRLMELLDSAEQSVPDELRSLAALPSAGKRGQPGSKKLAKREGLAIIASTPRPIVAKPETAQQNTWLHRIEKRIGCGIGVTKRAAKRAKQKALLREKSRKPLGDKKKKVAPKVPAPASDASAAGGTQNGADKKVQKCRHKRHRLAAKAAKEGAASVAADGGKEEKAGASPVAAASSVRQVDQKCVHKRHRDAAKAEKAGVPLQTAAQWWQDGKKEKRQGSNTDAGAPAEGEAGKKKQRWNR